MLKLSDGHLGAHTMLCLKFSKIQKLKNNHFKHPGKMRSYVKKTRNEQQYQLNTDKYK